MIVYDMLHFRDIKSSSSKVCAHENIATTITELIERAFAHLLLHSPMIGLMGKLLTTQILSHSIDRLAMITEDNSLSAFERTQ